MYDKSEEANRVSLITGRDPYKVRKQLRSGFSAEDIITASKYNTTLSKNNIVIPYNGELLPVKELAKELGCSVYILTKVYNEFGKDRVLTGEFIQNNDISSRIKYVKELEVDGISYMTNEIKKMLGLSTMQLSKMRYRSNKKLIELIRDAVSPDSRLILLPNGWYLRDVDLRSMCRVSKVMYDKLKSRSDDSLELLYTISQLRYIEGSKKRARFDYNNRTVTIKLVADECNIMEKTLQASVCRNGYKYAFDSAYSGIKVSELKNAIEINGELLLAKEICDRFEITPKHFKSLLSKYSKERIAQILLLVDAL